MSRYLVRKIIVGLTFLVVLNLLLYLSGIFIPWIISTNQLPLLLIIFILTLVIFGIGIAGNIIFDKYLKKKIRKTK